MISMNTNLTAIWWTAADEIVRSAAARVADDHIAFYMLKLMSINNICLSTLAERLIFVENSNDPVNKSENWVLWVHDWAVHLRTYHWRGVFVFEKVGLPTLPFIHRSYARLNISWCLSQHKIMCGVRSSTITCSCKRTHGTPTKVTRVLTKASRWFLKLN